MDFRDFKKVRDVLDRHDFGLSTLHPDVPDDEPFMEIRLDPENLDPDMYTRRSPAMALNALALAGLVRAHPGSRAPYSVVTAVPGYIMLRDEHWMPDGR